MSVGVLCPVFEDGGDLEGLLWTLHEQLYGDWMLYLADCQGGAGRSIPRVTQSVLRVPWCQHLRDKIRVRHFGQNGTPAEVFRWGLEHGDPWILCLVPQVRLHCELFGVIVAEGLKKQDVGLWWVALSALRGREIFLPAVRNSATVRPSGNGWVTGRPPFKYLKTFPPFVDKGRKQTRLGTDLWGNVFPPRITDPDG